MPPTKELHFFDRHYANGIADYERHFEGAENYAVVGEATPDYLYDPDIPERIHRHLPQCKMILCLRNPIDRVYSRYWNSKAKFVENRALSFEEKLAKKPLFLEEGKYFTHLQRYYQFFAPEQFLILLFEDIEQNPEILLSRTFSFLGVDPEFRPSRVEERINAAAGKPYLAKSRALFYTHKVLGRLGLRRLADALASRNMAELPRMDFETLRWLREDIYLEENLKLQELTGIDVSSWN